MPTPFEPNKTAKELGINTSKVFVIVGGEDWSDDWKKSIGKRVVLAADINSIEPCFQTEDFSLLPHGMKAGPFYWHELAYADDQEQKPEAKEQSQYVPQIGDMVQLEGRVTRVDGELAAVTFNNINQIMLDNTEISHAKLLSRPKPKLRLTMQQLREKVGEDFEIVG